MIPDNFLTRTAFCPPRNASSWCTTQAHFEGRASKLTGTNSFSFWTGRTGWRAALDRLWAAKNRKPNIQRKDWRKEWGERALGFKCQVYPCKSPFKCKASPDIGWNEVPWIKTTRTHWKSHTFIWCRIAGPKRVRLSSGWLQHTRLSWIDNVKLHHTQERDDSARPLNLLRLAQQELLKLRRKITNTVQVLTHLKEKMQFVQGENQKQKAQLQDVEEETAKVPETPNCSFSWSPTAGSLAARFVFAIFFRNSQKLKVFVHSLFFFVLHQRYNPATKRNTKSVNCFVFLSPQQRDKLTRTKQARDHLRIDNHRLRQSCGLLGNEPLLRDFEHRKDESSELKERLEKLQVRHAELSLSSTGFKKKIHAVKQAQSNWREKLDVMNSSRAFYISQRESFKNILFLCCCVKLFYNTEKDVNKKVPSFPEVPVCKQSPRIINDRLIATPSKSSNICSNVCASFQ